MERVLKKKQTQNTFLFSYKHKTVCNVFSVLQKKAWVVPDPHWWRSSAPEKRKAQQQKAQTKKRLLVTALVLILQ